MLLKLCGVLVVIIGLSLFGSSLFLLLENEAPKGYKKFEIIYLAIGVIISVIGGIMIFKP